MLLQLQKGEEAMKAHLFRTRVAVLWVAVAVAALGSLLLYLLVPGALEELLRGEMEGETLDDAMGYFFVALAAIPLAMAAVTLLVSERVNRSVNLIAGLAFGSFGVYAVVNHIVTGDFNAHVLMAGVASALAFLIAGLGMVGLRKPTTSADARGYESGRPREEVTV